MPPWFTLSCNRRHATRISIYALLLAVAIGLQIYGAVKTTPHSHELKSLTLDDGATKIRSITTATRFAKGFGACLMVKEDNDLLHEWIAYHYTVLPLSFLVVGSDLNNKQDPSKVLERWRNVSDFHFHLLEAQDFIDRHGNYAKLFTRDEANLTESELKDHHHHALVHRQKGFLSTCSELLIRRGVKWTTYIDSDEFLAFNPLSDVDVDLAVGGKGHLAMTNTSFHIRKGLLTKLEKTATDILEEIGSYSIASECITIPRLLVGALENKTCSVKFIQDLAYNDLGEQIDNMSTLRFFQHAKKGDFAQSKYGKVMMDLSQIPESTVLSKLPRNIHRPYQDHCGPAMSHFPDSFFLLMHYIGPWERYASRSDERRNRVEWEKRAFVNDDTSACSSQVAHWYLRFRKKVGVEHAKFLLKADV